MYSQEQVYAASLDYFNGNELAADVFVTKYPLRDDKGLFLDKTLDDRHRAIAKVFAEAEAKWDHDPIKLSEEDIYNLFRGEQYLLLQGGPLAAIGNKTYLQSSSNCFVIAAPYDSYGGICYTDEELAQLMKRRGGVGLNIDTIRPADAPVANAARTSSGIGAFQERYSNTCREVGQDGRRGAEIQLCSVHHPEINTFINIKRDKTKVTGANLTVTITDEFMEAVNIDQNYCQRFPVEPYFGCLPEIEKSVPAKDVWSQIVDAAWDNAEPGVAFIDTIRRNTPGNAYETIYASNPCGEIFMPPYDSCRLLVLNLVSYVKNPFTDFASFDFELFKQHARFALRILDDLVEVEIDLIGKIIAKIEADPEPMYIKIREIELWQKIKHTAEQYRRTGLGITGLADALAGLNIEYGSIASISMTEDIYKAMTTSAYAESYRLAAVRGPFPAFTYRKELNHPFLSRINEELFGVADLDLPRRNVALTTTAPVGSRSLMAKGFGNTFGVTSGLEPVWKIKSIRRKRITNNDLQTVVPDFVDALGDKWKNFAVNHSGYDYMKSIDPNRDCYVEAAAVYYRARVRLQAAAQKWVCHSISSTINLPKDVPKSTIDAIYKMAHEQELKGVTVYRDTCRDGILISDSIDSTDKPFVYMDSPKRPEKLKVDIHVVKSGDNALTILVGLLENKPFEVFILAQDLDVSNVTGDLFVVKTSKSNGQRAYALVDDKDTVLIPDVRVSRKQLSLDYHAIARLTSLLLRHHVSPQFVVEQLDKIAQSSSNAMHTCYSMLSRILKNYIPTDAKSSKSCPSCGNATLIYVEGCIQCSTCGFSKCG